MKFFSAVSVFACALLVSATSVNAEPLHLSKHRHVVVHSHRVVNKVVTGRPVPLRTVTTVTAFSLNSLPIGYIRFVHADETFYYSEGVYYQKKPHGFVMVKPRSGFRVAALPSGYRIVRERGATYYSFNNVRYRKLDGFFVVV